MYKSPINVYETGSELVNEISKEKDNYVMDCIVKMGVYVDKKALIQALKYDRGQYEKGFKDAKELYKWHNLRINPDDLPNLYTPVLIAVNLFSREMYMICDLEADGKFHDGINPHKLYDGIAKAWKYIEPFEVSK